jgi:hypothetical protein
LTQKSETPTSVCARVTACKDLGAEKLLDVCEEERALIAAREISRLRTVRRNGVELGLKASKIWCGTERRA